jgi:nucleotide-binding universal stress UspA family protein
MSSLADSPGPVLLAYDGTEGATHAIAMAGRMLQPRAAVVVYAWHPLSAVLLWNPIIGSPGPLAEPAAELDRAGRQAAHRLAEEGVARARDAGFDPTGFVAEARHGAWRALLRAAELHDARLLVLGSHGRPPSGLGRIGSVAAAVVGHSTRPVFVVPAAHASREAGPDPPA